MKNNFDILRLIFAFQVVLMHLALFQGASSGWLGKVLNPTWHSTVSVAVQGFFVISGYLIYASWLRSDSLRDYVAKRARRIYPAYLAAILVGAVVAWIGYEGGMLAFLNEKLVRYLIVQGLFMTHLQNTIPGSFADHPVQWVNGALWTIKVEVMFYAALPCMAFALARMKPWLGLALLYVAGEAFAAWCLGYGEGTGMNRLAQQLPGQLAFFVVGMAGWTYREALIRHASGILPLSLALYVIAEVTGLQVLRPLALGGIVLTLAIGIRPLANGARYGDLSYGTYVYHFPILHLMACLGLFAHPSWFTTGMVLAATAAAAWISWHLIERPWLRSGSHYRQASER